MAGIYLHIPFCKQACHYCNFHFSTGLRQKPALLEALKREISLRADYFGAANPPIESVYFGGGTPSLLSLEELLSLYQALAQHFDLSQVREITLEANPDDLNPDYLRALRQDSPVNRLSIGIQSLYEEDLRFMNRAHNAAEALAALELARQAGFEQLSIDLIYGSPALSPARWQETLAWVAAQGLPHLSCYALTVEPKTRLDKDIRLGRLAPVDEDKAATQFEQLSAWAQEAGYEHYEISNLCLSGQYALHNSNYWRGKPYLGLGPSAHSFDGRERAYNIAHNGQYIRDLDAGLLPLHLEVLSLSERYNEYLMTGLRTRWGLSLAYLEAQLGLSYRQRFEAALANPRFANYLETAQESGHYRFTSQGRLLSDGLLVDLFLD